LVTECLNRKSFKGTAVGGEDLILATGFTKEFSGIYSLHEKAWPERHEMFCTVLIGLHFSHATNYMRTNCTQHVPAEI
jgi:hypothetical protein